jgi:hypothetical protein
MWNGVFWLFLANRQRFTGALVVAARHLEKARQLYDAMHAVQQRKSALFALVSLSNICTRLRTISARNSRFICYIAGMYPSGHGRQWGSQSLRTNVSADMYVIRKGMSEMKLNTTASDVLRILCWPPKVWVTCDARLTATSLGSFERTSTVFWDIGAQIFIVASYLKELHKRLLKVGLKIEKSRHCIQARHIIA